MGITIYGKGCHVRQVAGGLVLERPRHACVLVGRYSNQSINKEEACLAALSLIPPRLLSDVCVVSDAWCRGPPAPRLLCDVGSLMRGV